MLTRRCTCNLAWEANKDKKKPGSGGIWSRDVQSTWVPEFESKTCLPLIILKLCEDRHDRPRPRLVTVFDQLAEALVVSTSVGLGLRCCTMARLCLEHQQLDQVPDSHTVMTGCAHVRKTCLGSMMLGWTDSDLPNDLVT